ncbi:hypothetical protein Pam5_42 [Pseudanabaena phage Pam5]|nr:hypothetical protein Pam5_42 [Pseudanabaena phage Pam5]
MRRASIQYAIAARDSSAMRWLRIAAELRRQGQLNDARVAVRCSRLWPAPKLPDAKRKAG